MGTRPGRGGRSAGSRRRASTSCSAARMPEWGRAQSSLAAPSLGSAPIQTPPGACGAGGCGVVSMRQASGPSPTWRWKLCATWSSAIRGAEEEWLARGARSRRSSVRWSECPQFRTQDGVAVVAVSQLFDRLRDAGSLRDSPTVARHLENLGIRGARSCPVEGTASAFGGPGRSRDGGEVRGAGGRAWRRPRGRRGGGASSAPTHLLHRLGCSGGMVLGHQAPRTGTKSGRRCRTNSSRRISRTSASLIGTTEPWSATFASSRAASCGRRREGVGGSASRSQRSRLSWRQTGRSRTSKAPGSPPSRVGRCSPLSTLSDIFWWLRG
jgi:hypothetical protein